MNGEEVVIAKAGRPMVRLVPVGDETTPRVGGQWKGRVRIADDFDVLPDDVAAVERRFRRTVGDDSDASLEKPGRTSGVACGPSPAHRALDRMGITRKKSRGGRPSRTGPI